MTKLLVAQCIECKNSCCSDGAPQEPVGCNVISPAAFVDSVKEKLPEVKLVR